MFAYCGNNPINYSDPSGYLYHSPHMPIDINGVGGGCRYLPATRPDFVEFLLNEDEEAVLDAEYLAFYHGAMVVKVPFMESSAFSFGIIFMGSDVKDPNLVRHEYGHIKQLKEVGLTDYLTYVVLPSVTCFQLTQNGVLPRNMYYSLPWEYIANVYGSAEGNYTDWASTVANIYWQIVGML